MAAEPLRDKNGLTEEEFLAQYSPKDYPRPSLTADICVFRHVGEGDDHHLQLLLVQRGGHPYLGCWATPGGFCNPGETADECAARELEEETHVAGLKLEPVALYSTPGRDPRGWTLSYAFVALDDAGALASAGDDAAKTAWFDVSSSASKDTGETTLRLTHGNDVLTSTFRSIEAPITKSLRAGGARGDGLAFDHARIIADAWLTLVQAELV